MDKIDGADLANKDAALVVTANKAYAYFLDATSGAAESSPDVVKPDTNAGTKRWILKQATMDYADVSGNDAATDITGAELEELTDGSDTALHTHTHGHAAGPTTDDHSAISDNDGATDVTGTELEALTDGSETALHTHAEGGTTDDHSAISDNDGATDVTGTELEALTDGGETALHSHAPGGGADYDDISGNDGATDVTGAELEELTDASETTLHSHAAAGGGFDSKFSAYKSTSFSVDSGVWTTAVLSGEFYDGLNEYDKDTNYRFTADETGYYHFTANCDVASLGSDKAFEVRFTKNGAETIQTGRPGQGNASKSGTYTRAHISQSVYLEANDYVEVEVWHNHGSSRTCGQGISTFTGERFA